MALAGAVALVSGTAAVAYVTHLEKDNQFCVACHAPEGKRLHGELFQRYDAKPPVNLSAAHASAKRTVKCIDCHGGAGVERRSRVLFIAAWDTLKYLTGRFKEPDRMVVPLRDRECVQCHADYEAGPFPEGGQVHDRGGVHVRQREGLRHRRRASGGWGLPAARGRCRGLGTHEVLAHGYDHRQLGP